MHFRLDGAVKSCRHASIFRRELAIVANLACLMPFIDLPGRLQVIGNK